MAGALVPRLLAVAPAIAVLVAVVLGLPGIGLYLWLGLAMSGPIILFAAPARGGRVDGAARGGPTPAGRAPGPSSPGC